MMIGSVSPIAALSVPYMQRFTCDCGNVLFFGSSQCLSCGNQVGYDPVGDIMMTIRPGNWMKRCGNGLKYGVCNWLVDGNKGEVLCLACRMNRTIPDLTLGRNLQLWGRMESAKRRLVYTLLRIGITLPQQAERTMVEKNDMEWTKTADIGADSILFNTFHGGSDSTWAPSRACAARFSEFSFLR